MMGTPKKVPLILGKPHIPLMSTLHSKNPTGSNDSVAGVEPEGVLEIMEFRFCTWECAKVPSWGLF